MSLDKTVRLEAYVARPPTSKCREVIAVMEEAARRHPDQVRLVVFERGAQWSEEPSRALKYAIHKGCTVPLCFADGKLIVGGKVPTLDEVERGILNTLRDRSGEEPTCQEVGREK
jgi:hypothetical protein